MDSRGDDSPENWGDAIDLFSGALAAANACKTCPIHEDCDGSCTGTPLRFQPLQSRNAVARVITSSAPKLLSKSIAPRDIEWLQAQHLEDFGYSPLGAGASFIRLLKIKPAIFRADIVECELLTDSLDSKPRYNALSYTWGKAVFDQPILINGQRKTITAGLQSALKSYRQQGSKFHDELLWVDAICINQTNSCEKTEQLPLMRRIYSEARCVYIDLGDVNESWYPGFDLLNKLSLSHHFEGRYPRSVPSADTILKRYRLPNRQHPAWALYMHIFGSPWFRRTWILQEVALAGHAIARFGRFVIEWESLEKSSTMFSRLGMHLSLHVVPVAVTTGFFAMFKIQELCDLRRAGLSPFELIQFLRITNNSRVSDSRDKVIGILGLVRSPRTQAMLPFLTDYTLGVDNTYHRLAVHLIELGCTQKMLSHAGLHRRSCITTAPSWVPDWTAQSRDFGPLPLVLFRPQMYQAATAYNMRTKLPGAESTTPLSPNVATLRTLVVAGDIVDEVAFLSTARHYYIEGTMQSSGEILFEFMLWLMSARMSLEKEYDAIGFTSSFNEALSCTLLVGDFYTGENATTTSSPIVDVGGCYQEACELLLAAVKRPDSFRIPENRRQSAAETFLEQMVAATPGKKLAITKEGRMCLMPNCTATGDKIGILLGANVPYILRTTSETHRPGAGHIRALLVGDAYVHGMMDGEALEREDFVTKEIHLY